MGREVSMKLEGKVWKSGKHWLVEVPSLDVMTQGYSKEEALMMIRDAILQLTKSYFETDLDKDFDIAVHLYKKNVIGITATNNGTAPKNIHKSRHYAFTG
jgi:predicted RNase H-like HicB family nuclease